MIAWAVNLITITGGGKRMNDASLRKHIQSLLRGGGAHVSFGQAIADLPATQRGEKPQGAAHTVWQVVEHMRIAQWDILEFSRDPKHISPEFPAAYWPPTEAPPDAAAWERSLALFRADLAAMEKLV